MREHLRRYFLFFRPWRLEKELQAFAGTALEIEQSYHMPAFFQRHLPGFLQVTVTPVIVRHHFIIDEQLGSVIRKDIKRINSRNSHLDKPPEGKTEMIGRRLQAIQGGNSHYR